MTGEPPGNSAGAVTAPLLAVWFVNDRERPYAVILEPWATSCELAPGDRALVVGRLDGHHRAPTVAVREDLLSFYWEGPIAYLFPADEPLPLGPDSLMWEWDPGIAALANKEWEEHLRWST